MPSKKPALTTEEIDNLIREIRGEKVILDSDLARLYGVTTKRLNEEVKRNQERFPGDFTFQLTAKESAAWRSQFATSSSQEAESEEGVSNRSQIAAGSQKHRDPRLRPYAFIPPFSLSKVDFSSSTPKVPPPGFACSMR